jgi:hypothetical protein
MMHRTNTIRTCVGAALLAAAVLTAGAAPANPASGGRNWIARSVSDLIADINAANLAGGVNSITLAPGRTFTLTAVNNTTDGPTGLPVIAANNNLTIRGNGATIARSTAPGTPAFRLFDVAPGAALTLEDLTLANGQAIADPASNGCGGAVLVAAGASLTVKRSAFVGNRVVGGDGGGGLGGFGFGGAVCTDGVAVFDCVVFRGNEAMGGATTSPDPENFNMVSGGLAWGGAISSQNLGALTVRQCRFTGNKAIGGHRRQPSGQYDGAGVSGAIDSWGAASIGGSMFDDNQAIGGTSDVGVNGGFAMGGAAGSGGPQALSPACTIRDCRFSHNLAIGADAGRDDMGGWGVGGALSSGYSLYDSRITVSRCSFTGNRAIGGAGGFGGWGCNGAINIESPLVPPATSVASFDHCSFEWNQAVGGEAGGVAVAGAIGNLDYNEDDGSGATLMISDCRFTGNEARGAAGGHGEYWEAPGYAESGAVDTNGSATVLNSTFLDNRAVGGALSPGAMTGFFSASSGGGLSSWGGALYIRDSRFINNRVVGGDVSLGGPAGIAMGGGITVFSGLQAAIIDCTLSHNTVVGGAGDASASGGFGVGGGLNVGFYPSAWAVGPSSAVTVTGTRISHNRAIGGAGGGVGRGGGYAVGTGILCGIPDTSTVTLDDESVVRSNAPDDAYQFDG